MEDNILECNVTFKRTEEVTSFMLDKKYITSYEYLETKLMGLFPKLQAFRTFTVTWINKEGDEVRLNLCLVTFAFSVIDADSHQ